MRIALTGASCTGKSMLSNAIIATPAGIRCLKRRLPLDARELLREMGAANMDRMSVDDTRVFQTKYFAAKKALEACYEDFITDRSFVDVAAYWIERDAPGDIDGDFVHLCRTEAQKYDLHVYCPWGAIPFVPDGYRSTNVDLHARFDRRVQTLLEEWRLTSLTLSATPLDERLRMVLQAIADLAS